MVALTLATPASAKEENPLGLSFVETPRLTLVYFDSLAPLVPHATRTFTRSFDWQRRIFGWQAAEPVGVLLKDFGDYGGGAAWTAPRNSLQVDVSPSPSAFETKPAAEHMYSLMNHELVHLATGDSTSSEDRFWRGLFRGKVPANSQHPETLLYNFLTVPRFAVPRWYLEGSATFMETWMGGGIGRAQGGYDEMVFRAMVRDKSPLYDPLGLASRGVMVDFQVGANAYLYGTRFFTWLALEHTPEKVVQWLRRDEGSRRHYADQFEKVFGKPLERAWADWIAFEQTFQGRNLERVRAQPITPYEPLKGLSAGSVSRTYYDESTGMLYGGFKTPGLVEHIGALDTRSGRYRVLAEIKGGMLYRVTSFAFDPGSKTAFYTSDNYEERDLMALDVETGRQRMLIKDARIGEMAVDPRDRSLIGVRHHEGIASFVRLAPPYDQWKTLRDLPYGMVPSDLDISRDGKLISATVSEVNADQFLRVWELDSLLAGKLEPLREFAFGAAIPEGFNFSRDGRYLLGTSYYTGVSNVFRFEWATGKLEAMTNAETGFFRPVERADGRTLVLAYTGAGFVPSLVDARPLSTLGAITFLGAEVAKRHPVVTTWQVEPPGGVDDQALITRRGIYRPLEQLKLQNAYPVLQGYKDFAGLGWRVNFGDPVQLASLSVTGAVTPAASGGEQAHLEVAGKYLGWRASASWNRSDFYDLFGPTKTSRKGLALKLSHERFLLYEDPRKFQWINEAAWFDRIDTLPGAQNVGSGFTRLARLESRLEYSDQQRSLGAVEDEQGLRWNGSLTVHSAGGGARPLHSALLRGGLDLGISLPWAHSSLWSRTAVGVSQGRDEDRIAGFYFGAFGNNWVDNRAAARYRDYGAMPGFEIDEISARRFVRQMVEWTLPPVVFESLGMPAFHLSWMRPALFAAALRTQDDQAPRRGTYSSLGAQIDWRFSVQHWYEFMLSTGVARGFEGSRRRGTEWMLSLKIL